MFSSGPILLSLLVGAGEFNLTATRNNKSLPGADKNQESPLAG
jgi:hypothetical protein